MDGLDAGKLLALVCDRSNVTREQIGKIDLKGAYSFFEVDKEYTNIVRDHLHGFEYKGRMVRIEVTDANNGSSSGSRKGGGSYREKSGGGGYHGKSYGGKSKGKDRDRKKSRW